MNGEILSRIDALAAALGLSAGTLWAALVRQGIVSGWYGLFEGLCLGGAGLYIARRALRHDCEHSGDCLFCGGGLFAVWLAVAAFSILSLIALDDTKWLFNPQGYAAEKIVGALTPKAAK